MEKFTKGPWSVDKYGNIVQQGGKTTDAGCCIRAGGLALTTNDGEPMANRYLIAAAPEMYEMLKLTKENYENLIKHASVNALYLVVIQEEISAIDELLAKARGE